MSFMEDSLKAGVCYTTRGGGNPSVSRAGEGYGLTVITVHEDANPYDGSVARYKAHRKDTINTTESSNFVQKLLTRVALQ